MSTQEKKGRKHLQRYFRQTSDAACFTCLQGVLQCCAVCELIHRESLSNVQSGQFDPAAHLRQLVHQFCHANLLLGVVSPVLMSFEQFDRLPIPKFRERNQHPTEP